MLYKDVVEQWHPGQWINMCVSWSKHLVLVASSMCMLVHVSYVLQAAKGLQLDSELFFFLFSMNN